MESRIRIICTILLAAPVVIVCSTVDEVGQLKYVIGITGVFVVYVIPILLNIFSRKRKIEDWRGEANFHRTMFSHFSLYYIILAFSVMGLSLILYNLFSNGHTKLFV